MRLVKYNEIKELPYMAYMYEWEATQEKIVPMASGRYHKDFETLQKEWCLHEDRDYMAKKGYVPATLYFLLDGETIIGSIHLRQELNDFLLKEGGHLGYGIRPSKRRQGYASLMLELMLEEVKKYHLQKVLITCDEENIGSARTIEKNGGLMENRVETENGLTRRYWIEVK